MNRRVVILQETLPAYRVAFFAEVRRVGLSRGITIDVLHGYARGARGSRLSTGELECAEVIRNRYIRAPGSNGVLVWQSALKQCLRAELVVVEQANRMIINYMLLAAQWLGGPKVAFWGHGRNLQAARRTSAERVKAKVSLLPWWWFAYTSQVADYLDSLGVDRARTTTVGNTIDVVALRAAVDRARAAGATAHQWRCGYLGGLYPEKRLDVLFQAADLLARDATGFELHIAGDGELRPAVEKFAATRPWVTYRGTIAGSDRAQLLATCRLILMPGLVGLVVLDSFASGVPLVTMADSLHSPEIEYLQDGVNGVLVAAGSGSREYAAIVRDLLRDERAWAALRRGALASVDRHGVSAAAERFVSGVEAALAGNRPRVRTCAGRGDESSRRASKGETPPCP